MNIHIFHHEVNELHEVHKKLDEILAYVKDIRIKEITMSAQLDTLTAEVTETGTVIDSAIELINGLAAQIAAIKDDPVAIQALADELNAKSEALAAAVQANTPPPAEPTP